MATSSAPLLQGEDLDPMPQAPRYLATTTLKVDGMTCGACTSAVEEAFKGVKGAGDVSVSLIMGRAVVHHDPTILSAEMVAEMVEDRGFDSKVLSTELPREVPQEDEEGEDREDNLLDVGSSSPSISTTTLRVGGMTCGACTSAVEGGLADIPGVSSVTVSLLSERAIVEHDKSMISPEKIAEIVEDRGFDAEILETAARYRNPSSSRGKSVSRKEPTHVTTTISIEGMTCGACTSAVENALKDQPGMVRFNVSLLAERGVVVHDPSVLRAAHIAELIEDAGFDVKILSSREDDSIQSNTSASLALNIYGLPDSTAATNLERAFRKTDGVLTADVKLSNSRALISYSPTKVGIRRLVEVVEQAGYNALLVESDDGNAQLESLAKTKEIHEWRKAFWFSFSFAVPVMVISMLLPMYLPAIDIGNFELIPGLFSGEIICLLLTIPVQFGVGKRFYIASFKSLKHGSPTMDVLVMLGTSAAFFFSILAMLVSVFFKPHSRPMTVFETSTMLITFISLGRWLENRAKGQTSRALSRLMSLAPSMATIYDDPVAVEMLAENWGSVPLSAEMDKAAAAVSTVQKTIPTELIQVGDIVCLRPGDKVPADGVVIRGESYIDEGMITGEAIPIRKIKTSKVMAGTVNGAGWVDFRVTRAGRDTQLSQIVKLVQDAQTSRAPIQRMADIVAGYFVPAIITLGLITFFGWMILSHILPNPPKIFVTENPGGTFMVCLKLCISVIVFACPCALGLSTPTAVMVGTGVGAEHGILVKGGAALEAATKITHVVFDKTGTLTMGKMSVSGTRMDSTWTSNDWRRRQWWLIVGLAELTSEHPIGKAILAKARSEVGASDENPLNGSVADFEALVGKGISAIVEPTSNVNNVRHRVLVGSARFLRSRDINVPQSAEPEPDSSEFTTSISVRPRKDSEHVAGSTLIHVAIDGKYAGTITLQDTLKPTAAAAVAALHRMGLTTSLITGDSLSTALAVASSVGIPASSVHASVSPSEKQSVIASLQKTPSSIVAMVGDGINDSPALATASVGIALASGTDVAIEAADIVLMRPDDLLSVPASLCLSRSIFRRIKLNLLWACMYNAIGIPFAMGLFLPFGGISLHPMAAGAAMAASSVSVVVSSLLLKFWKRPGWLDSQKLEREAELGLIDTSGLSRGGRGSWWKKSPFTSDQTRRGRRTFAWLVTLGSDAVMSVTGKRRNGTDDEGYVPLRPVEPVSV
ncbi:copper-transporting ATPase [Histoplasma capsulatum var. duboisii H88]|uniref:P-type Cu(+) transporter n=1 Tax=Ajellomyces capsulatus (strain H88) TaxID=544711 RepID=A0A8A1LK89_AJEC8|nr:copper-transporting ATPase [Histoplasma capsulatum var. duboisii H88]